MPPKPSSDGLAFSRKVSVAVKRIQKKWTERTRKIRSGEIHRPGWSPPTVAIRDIETLLGHHFDIAADETP